MDFIDRFFISPEQSFFLFGPRGTGKTYWIKQEHPGSKVIDLLRPENLAEYSAHPEKLREICLAKSEIKKVVIDEIQRIPKLLDVVHELIETPEIDIQFILTGSSSRKLKRVGINLLGGRAIIANLHPFLPAEIGPEFSLERSLRFGLLPLVYSKKSPQSTLKAYYGLYLKEEVQQEGIVRNLEQFSRFMEAMSFSQGNQLNYKQIASDCHVPRKTVENYTQILEDLLLGFKLPIFKKKAKRELVHQPKFYYFDVGVYRSIRPRGPFDNPAIIDGAAYETLLVQSIRAWNDYRLQENDLYFWKTTSDTEVDLVVYGEDGITALEFKGTDKLRSKDFTGLKLFHEDYPTAHLALVYTGAERIIKNGILCIPCREFLFNLHPDHSLQNIIKL